MMGSFVFIFRCQPTVFQIYIYIYIYEFFLKGETVWVLIRSYILSEPDWVQTVSKGYYQMFLAGKQFMLFIFQLFQ